MVEEPPKWPVRIIGIGLAMAFGLLLVVLSFQGAASSFSNKPTSLSDPSSQKQEQKKAPKRNNPSSDIRRGEALFEESGCVACHTDADTPIAPTLHGVNGSLVALEDGTTVQVDSAYITESILDPLARIVKGYSPIMPLSYKDDLTDKEVQALIAYIKSLK